MLIKQLSQDRALAEYVAPALGWEPARPGALPTGYDIDEVGAE